MVRKGGGRRALRDARDDVFENWCCGGGDGGGGVVVARRAGMVCASVLVAVEVTAEDGAKDGR